MQIKLYNHLSRNIEPFKPLKNKRVGLYTCGPTVYNFVHIGNLRTYIFEDVLHRALEYGGYRVRHVMNITDVDDKIIRDAGREGKNIREFTIRYEQAFFVDLKKLNIEPAWKYPRATEHVVDMVKLIRKLTEKGIAYVADGSVYFAIAKFKPYGKLSRVGKRTLKAGARMEMDEYTKENVQDFALWKGSKPGEPSWSSPFGEGRPGWHIECSAMAMKYLGAAFDIHAGGVDLIFPHHENEIAQSQGATGKTFARFFVEGEHLLVNNEKMSKSLGNVFTLRDVEERGANPLAFRYLALTSHYRSKLNFTWESLGGAEQSLKRLMEFVITLKSRMRDKDSESRIMNYESRKRPMHLSKYRKDFESAIAHDLDTPKALAVVWKLINGYNKKPEDYDVKEALSLLYDFDRVLGLGLKDITPETIPVEIIKMAKEREEYRKQKNWAKSDEIRDSLKADGYIIEDTAEGPTVKKI